MHNSRQATGTHPSPRNASLSDNKCTIFFPKIELIEWLYRLIPEVNKNWFHWPWISLWQILRIIPWSILFLQIVKERINSTCKQSLHNIKYPIGKAGLIPGDLYLTSKSELLLSITTLHCIINARHEDQKPCLSSLPNTEKEISEKEINCRCLFSYVTVKPYSPFLVKWVCWLKIVFYLWIGSHDLVERCMDESPFCLWPWLLTSASHGVHLYKVSESSNEK